MSSANLDLVRSICAEWERGRYSSVEWAHPEGEFVIEDLPGSGSWKGVAAGMQAWRQFLDAWEGHQIEVDEYRELDASRVLVLGAFRARGKASGVDLEQLRTAGANVFHLREREGDQARHLLRPSARAGRSGARAGRRHRRLKRQRGCRRRSFTSPIVGTRRRWRPAMRL